MLAKSSLVSLHGASVMRDGKWLVRGVSLSVAPGEIVTLIGPNGSGKSTTAKMALGLVEPKEGRAVRRGGLRIGYVPQKLTIDWSLPLSVERFMSLTDKLPREKLEAALERTGVAHLRHEQLRTLSGGEFQRALLARAIAREPEFLVLDEPVQGVDLAGQIALYELISAVRNDLGCGVLLVSHDLHIVMAATDRVICLNGHVCCEGTPASVVESEQYRQLFGAHASPALAVYEHHHDHTHLSDGRVQHADGSITEHCHPEDGHHNES